MSKRIKVEERRGFLRGSGLIVAGAAALGKSPSVAQAAPEDRRDSALVRNFKVEIDGVVQPDVDAVGIGDLTIDVVAGEDPGPGVFRTYAPGRPNYGSIAIRARVGAGTKELYQWWLDTSRGKNIRKSISVIALSREGVALRRFHFKDCLAATYDHGVIDHHERSERLESLIVLPSGLAITGRGEDLLPHKRSVLTVTIEGGGNGGDVDSAWETCSGGSLNIEIADGSTGSDQFHSTTPGHKYVDSLTLRGPLTSGRKALCEWISATVNREKPQRQVTVKEILKDGGAGKTFIYMDAFPTRYTFPKFSAFGTGNLYEEISIKPIRLEIA